MGCEQQLKWTVFMGTPAIDYRSLLAESLRRHRRIKAMSQNDLAEASRVTQATISDIENGRCNPTLDILCKLGAALDVPPFALIGADIALRELGAALPQGAAFGTTVGNLAKSFSGSVFSRWILKSILQVTDANENLPVRIPTITLKR
jgi:transcriptional regulator with XRE-family HTH domain